MLESSTKYNIPIGTDDMNMMKYSKNLSNIINGGTHFEKAVDSKILISRIKNIKMKLFLIFITSILTLSANGQIAPALRGKAAGIETFSTSNKTVDTVPSVRYNNIENAGLQPAYYLNGKFVNKSSLSTFDPQFIDSIHIEKKEMEIENKKYYGQVYITMKKEYTPKLISLTDLEQKYTNLRNGITVFMIDDDIIKEDYDQYLVDENYILKIIVDTIEMKKEKATVNVVRLLTKSKENIEKSEKIYIRGLGETKK